MLVLDARVSDPLLDSMNFLNEVTLRYPHAISFAPGRPAERHFRVAEALGALNRNAAHLAGDPRMTRSDALDSLAQYGRTNGIIHHLVARQLGNDEGLDADPATIVITAGGQEAMVVSLLTLFCPGHDVLLASDPVYQGITAAAHMLGIAVMPVPLRDRGVDPVDLAAAIARVRASGQRPRAIYLIPDFDNPSGVTLDMATRAAICAVAKQEDILIIEDTPYRQFRYDGKTLPMLKAVASEQVILIGSYAKSLFPGLRIGYVLADQMVTLGGGGPASRLADAMSRIKSLTTLNTSPLMQAVVGGILLESGCTLAEAMADKRDYYRGNRDRTLEALEIRLAPLAAAGVTWNRPAGGFFITVTLPFQFGMKETQECAEHGGVIVCPVSLFSISGQQGNRIRLAFGNIDADDIRPGIARLGAFLNTKLTNQQSFADSGQGGSTSGHAKMECMAATKELAKSSACSRSNTSVK